MKPFTIGVYHKDTQWGDRLSVCCEQNNWNPLEWELKTDAERFPWWRGTFNVDTSQLGSIGYVYKICWTKNNGERVWEVFGGNRTANMKGKNHYVRYDCMCLFVSMGCMIISNGLLI